jgi:hypothetical protein
MVDADASYHRAAARKVEAEARKVEAEVRKLKAEAAAIDFARRRDRALLLTFLTTTALGFLASTFDGCG